MKDYTQTCIWYTVKFSTTNACNEIAVCHFKHFVIKKLKLKNVLFFNFNLIN